MKVKIAIIGAGYIGLVNAYGYTATGHDVDVYDIDQGKLRKLNCGEMPIYEGGLIDLSIKHKLKYYHISGLKNNISKYDVIMICVGTPPKENGDVNLSYIENVFHELSCCEFNASIIIKSTIPPGTSRKLTHNYKIKNDVIFMPEFLKAGNALNDFCNPDRVVVGWDKPNIIINDLHPGQNLIIMSIESAELTKYAANTMLALRISFMNELAVLCETIGADIDEIADGIGSDKRIGPAFLHAGPGFGGSCLPKDVQGLANVFNNNKIQPLISHAIIDVNNRQISRLCKIITNLNVDNVGIYGLSFKRGTDDIRESISLALIYAIQHSANPICIHSFDPIIKEYNTMDKHTHHKCIIDMLLNIECLVLMHDIKITDHDQLGIIKSSPSMRYVVDPFRRLNKNLFESNKIKYICIGK